jgi:uncharacterized lipoprotein YehR (DUF1307 family)
MKKLLSLCCALSLALAAVGCSQKAESTKTSTVTTPGGETTTTEKTTIEKSGDNPPPANP